MNEQKLKLTEEQFKEFLRCQTLGLFNMFDFGNWKKYTTLNVEQWREAMTNYTQYKEAYGKK